MIEHVPPPQPEPSWRKPVGMLMICGLIALWAVLVASASSLIAQLPEIIQAFLYVVAGIIWIWILPLKPLLSWMETGSWKWGGPVAQAQIARIRGDKK